MMVQRRPLNIRAQVSIGFRRH